ncbi:SRPBCC domain-containing protein [Pedobacter endophyticus]|uniref:SRPBCC domain-containing protein n=1 Tax=Pedobacter endophyticus TaxID=2789740 RepID=A0A7S9KYD3_9SPHI|nr:SRPBCC domain-containing protein [Pedobacter endophyticus]QPH39129.1 SRPBCC domain-containing protein [Pedobacter endophyticus]
MEKITFNISIAAPAKSVWNTLLGVETYPKWTSVFAEGSAVETDWQKGSKALFHDGTGNGMVSKIEENIPYRFISIKHLGDVKDGIEDLNKGWGDAYENYTLEESDGKTNLNIELNVVKEWAEFMNDTWPQALEKVKELAETAGKAHVET